MVDGNADGALGSSESRPTPNPPQGPDSMGRAALCRAPSSLRRRWRVTIRVLCNHRGRAQSPGSAAAAGEPLSDPEHASRGRRQIDGPQRGADCGVAARAGVETEAERCPGT